MMSLEKAYPDVKKAPVLDGDFLGAVNRRIPMLNLSEFLDRLERLPSPLLIDGISGYPMEIKPCFKSLRSQKTMRIERLKNNLRMFESFTLIITSSFVPGIMLK